MNFVQLINKKMRVHNNPLITERQNFENMKKNLISEIKRLNNAEWNDTLQKVESLTFENWKNL